MCSEGQKGYSGGCCPPKAVKLEKLKQLAKCCYMYNDESLFKQESRSVARKPRDAAAVLFGLKFADNIHYNFKSSQASKARLQSSKHTGAKQNLTQNGHSRSSVLESWER